MAAGSAATGSPGSLCCIGGNRSPTMKNDSTAGDKFQKLVELMGRLRAPGGCPWDREQTFDSIKPYTLEETYEVLDAIERREWKELAEELGDFLLQAVFYAQMGSEQGLFGIEDALDAMPRAPRRWGSIGRIPSRCSRSCVKSWPSSTRRGATLRPCSLKTSSANCCSCANLDILRIGEWAASLATTCPRVGHNGERNHEPHAPTR
jgi:NTP pyrophosphatase (non-canonical NTP hydrolase)